MFSGVYLLGQEKVILGEFEQLMERTIIPEIGTHLGFLFFVIWFSNSLLWQ